MVVRAIDIRRLQFKTELPAIVFECHQTIGVVQIGTHHGCHKRRWIVRLKIGRLIRQHGISRRVRLIEAVARELLHQVEYVGRGPVGDAPCGCAADEDLSLLCHLLRLLLTHRTPQQIRRAKRVAGKNLRDLHHLLLIQDHAIGFLKYRLQFRVQVIDIGFVGRVFARDEVIHHAGLQRPRTKQCDECYQIIELVRSHAFDEVTHAAGLKLEDSGGMSCAQ